MRLRCCITCTIPLQNGQIVQKRDDLKRSDRSAWNMYFVFLDRFKDGNSQNNRQVDDPEIHPSVNYYGVIYRALSR